MVGVESVGHIDVPRVSNFEKHRFVLARTSLGYTRETDDVKFFRTTGSASESLLSIYTPNDRALR
jgi:hypothetical protein